MKLKFKKLYENTVLPKHAKRGDAGMDITAISVEEKRNQVIYGTGLSVEIPNGYVGLLFSRSSIYKKDLYLSNATGVLDSGYRGEIKFIFNKKHDTFNDIYNIGDRIGQLVVVPYESCETEFVDELSETERGSGGYGSTGT